MGMKETAVLMGDCIMMDKKRGPKRVKKRSEVHKVKQKRAEATGNTKDLLVFLKYCNGIDGKTTAVWMVTFLCTRSMAHLLIPF